MTNLVVGLTGASGSIYFLRLMEQLFRHSLHVHVVATEQGRRVLTYETGVVLEEQVLAWRQGGAQVTLQANDNMFSPIASGSFLTGGMVVLPCSMSTLAEIATGAGKTLLPRTADVMIKERRKLILVPRETPLSAIHLGNMHALAQLGVTILPAMPGFYHKPQSLADVVDFVVGKVLDSLELPHECYQRWEGSHEENHC